MRIDNVLQRYGVAGNLKVTGYSSFLCIRMVISNELVRIYEMHQRRILNFVSQKSPLGKDFRGRSISALKRYGLVKLRQEKSHLLQ